MKLAGILFLLVVTHATGAPGSYYAGESQDKHTFTLYLDGGAFLGQDGDFHSIKTDIHVTRGGRAIKTTDRCRFIYNPKNDEENRIECSNNAGSRLSGAVYVRDKQRHRNKQSAQEDMVCVQGCKRNTPRVLQLTLEEDTG